MPYGEADVQNLKSQVLTLIKEVQESSAKLTNTTKTLEKKSARCVCQPKEACILANLLHKAV